MQDLLNYGKRVVDLFELFDGSIADASYGSDYSMFKEKIGVQEPYEIYVIHIGMAPKRRFFFKLL